MNFDSVPSNLNLSVFFSNLITKVLAITESLKVITVITSDYAVIGLGFAEFISPK